MKNNNNNNKHDLPKWLNTIVQIIAFPFIIVVALIGATAAAIVTFITAFIDIAFYD